MLKIPKIFLFADDTNIYWNMAKKGDKFVIFPTFLAIFQEISKLTMISQIQKFPFYDVASMQKYHDFCFVAQELFYLEVSENVKLRKRRISDFIYGPYKLQNCNTYCVVNMIYFNS